MSVAHPVRPIKVLLVEDNPGDARLILAMLRDAPAELIAYLGANAKWAGDDNELQAKVAGAMHLILGSAYYQFV